MIKDKLNSLIMEAMKEGRKIELSTLRDIKTAIMQWETAKENVGKVLNEDIEMNLLRKLRDQYIDASVQCNDGKHDELVMENTLKANYINTMLPKPVSEEDILNCFHEIAEGGVEKIKRNTKVFMEGIKTKHPGADNKNIAKVIGGLLS